MHKGFFRLGLLLLLAWGLGQGQPVTAAPSLRERLEKINALFITTAITKDVAARMPYYAPDARSMPEYQPTLQGTAAIRAYYAALFQRQHVQAFTRHITEVLELSGTAVELGTFTLRYVSADGGAPITHSGKYWNVWSLQPDGTLRLKAEAWGYFHPVDNPATLLVALPGRPPQAAVGSAAAGKESVRKELQALNGRMEQAVRQRDGQARADLFTPDAVFMPFADSMQVGMAHIRRHLLAYNSGSVTIDSVRIYTTQVEAHTPYVLEYPAFYVRWRTPTAAGISQGKGIRLWKRMTDGSLKLYREIGLHDYVP